MEKKEEDFKYLQRNSIYTVEMSEQKNIVHRKKKQSPRKTSVGDFRLQGKAKDLEDGYMWFISIGRKERIASTVFEPYVGQGWRDGSEAKSGLLLQS